MGEPAVKTVPQQTFRVGKPVSLQLTGEDLHGRVVNLIEEPSAEYGGSGLDAASAGKVEVTTEVARTGTHSWRLEKTDTAGSMNTYSPDGWIAVKPGETICWSAYFRPATVGRIVFVTIQFADSEYKTLQESTGFEPTSVLGEWVRVDTIKTAPTNATYARPLWTVYNCEAGEVHYIDDLQSTEVDTAGLPIINLVPTPTGLKGIGGWKHWVNTSIALSSEGEWFVVPSEPGGPEYAGMENAGCVLGVGKTYSGRLWIYLPAAGTYQVQIRNPESTEVWECDQGSITVGAPGEVEVTWTDRTYAKGDATNYLTCNLHREGANIEGNVKMRRVQIVEGSALPSEADGDTNGYCWAGIPDESVSLVAPEPPEYADGDQPGCEWGGEHGISYQQPTWSAEGLPPGLSIDTETGLIEGTPKTTGTYTVTGTGYGDGTKASTSFTVVVVSGNPASIMPSTPTVPRNPFSYFSYDFLTGEPVGQIPLRGVKCGQQLNIAGQASGQLDLTDLRVRETNPLECTVPNKSLIVVDFLGAPVWGGPVMPRGWTVEGAPSASQRTLEVQLAETICYLAHRVQATDYSAPPYSGISGTEAMKLWRATPWDAGLITCQLIRDMLGVPYGDPLGGLGLLLNGEEPKDPVAPEDDWVAVSYPYTSAQVLETIIKELAELPFGASFDLGLDLAYSKGPGSAITGAVNVDYPRRGRTFAENNLVIDLSTSRGYKIPEDGSETGNQIYEIGGSGAIFVAENVNPLDQGYALWERVMSRANAQSQHIMKLLEQAGTSDLAIYSYAPVAPTVKLSVFDPNLPLGSFITGDDVLLCMPAKGPDREMFDERFPAGLEQEWRITGWEVEAKDEGDQTMTLTLAQPPYLEALAPAV